MTNRNEPALPRFTPMGACALLCEAPAPLEFSWQQRIWALAREAEKWPGVVEAMPGMNNLMLVFDPLAIEADALQAEIVRLWPHCSWEGRTGKTVEVDVVYGGENGMDLAHVAQHGGLSIPEVVRLHSEALYTVYFLGAYPGLAYMAGLHPKLFTPRRAEPRPQVPASAVAIGGAQATVIPLALPSGWHVIGQARQVFFDITKDPPALLAPGDQVRFRVERIET